jgi:hypothetical protein
MIARIYVSIGDDADASGEIESESFDPHTFSIIVAQVSLAARDAYRSIAEVNAETDE